MISCELRAVSFSPLMNSAYNFNVYIKDIFPGFHEWPLYTSLTVILFWTVLAARL
jgi:hypothetical protein